MGEIIIRYVGLPPAIKAYTLTDANDDYNIYVNSALNSIEQQKAVDHEVQHINAGHFYRTSSVALDEAEAEQPAVKVTPKPLPKTNNPGRPVHPVFYHLRQKSGLAAFQVAKLAGIRPSTYTQYEYCLRPCPPEDEQAIMNVLGKYR